MKKPPISTAAEMGGFTLADISAPIPVKHRVYPERVFYNLQRHLLQMQNKRRPDKSRRRLFSSINLARQLL